MRHTCAICGKWIWLDPYGPGWVHKNRGIFAADGHFATKDKTPTCPTCNDTVNGQRSRHAYFNCTDPWHTKDERCPNEGCFEGIIHSDYGHPEGRCTWPGHRKDKP